MKRVMLIVAYDGTEYYGWQAQSSVITVEEVLNRELSALLNEQITVIGASRTDSGVHAMGNVAVFDTETRIPADRICYALNQRLPDDIVIQESREVPTDFHPRFTDTKKTYEYRVYNATHPMPLNRRYTHFVYTDLDVDRMQAAANYLIGEHDFVSFCSVNTQVKSTVRTIYSLDVIKNNQEIIIRIQGNGFLYNMVRIIAGTLIQVGNHYYEPEKVAWMLEQKDRTVAGPTAPAKGLTLVKIEYL